MCGCMPWLAEIKAEETQTPTHTHSTKQTHPDHSRAEGYKGAQGTTSFPPVFV